MVVLFGDHNNALCGEIAQAEVSNASRVQMHIRPVRKCTFHFGYCQPEKCEASSDERLEEFVDSNRQP